jgi:hypothetical protein
LFASGITRDKSTVSGIALRRSRQSADKVTPRQLRERRGAHSHRRWCVRVRARAAIQAGETLSATRQRYLFAHNAASGGSSCCSVLSGARAPSRQGAAQRRQAPRSRGAARRPPAQTKQRTSGSGEKAAGVRRTPAECDVLAKRPRSCARGLETAGACVC